MLMILARLVRSESFWAVVKVRSPHNRPEVWYPRRHTNPRYPTHFSLLLADSSSPRMTDDYPSFGDSSLFGANVYYRGTVALGRTGMIPAAHVYEGGLRTAAHAWHVG